jgi:hypothetical protein
MNPTLVHSAAWAAAWATVLWQRLLLPALLVAFHSLRAASRESQPETPPRLRLAPAIPLKPLPLERMTCAQLRELAGTGRHLSKRELIARIQSIHDERNFG